MKPTKKRAAKRKYTDVQRMLIDKLISLKYRINDTYRDRGMDVLGKVEEKTKNDKSWVMDQISALREGFKLSKGNMELANDLWKEYSPSRLNDWESYKND